MIIITARRCGQFVTEEGAMSRAAADQLFAVIAREQPDCEITMKMGDAILLSVGPRASSVIRMGVKC